MSWAVTLRIYLQVLLRLPPVPLGFLKRTAEYMYNTLANLMFTNGNSAKLTDDCIITGEWSPEVVQFNS